MKSIFALVAMSLLAFQATAQDVKETDVPAPVQKEFKAKYPGIKATAWEMEGGNYEADFKMSGKSNSAVFESSGKFVQSEIDIDPTLLPEKAKTYVSKELGNGKVIEASKITLADGIANFEAEVGDVDYLFDAQGIFIKKETDTNDDKDVDEKD